MYENFSKANHNLWIKYFMKEATSRMVLRFHDDEQCEHYRFLSVVVEKFDYFHGKFVKVYLFSVISKTLVLSPRPVRICRDPFINRPPDSQSA